MAKKYTQTVSQPDICGQLTEREIDSEMESGSEGEAKQEQKMRFHWILMTTVIQF